MKNFLLNCGVLCVLFSALGSVGLFAQSASNVYTYGMFSSSGGHYYNNGYGLVADASGDLYGVQLWGGNPNGRCKPVGCGEVYKLTSPGGSFGSWKYQALYQFSASTDGCSPQGQLIMDASGALYGTNFGDYCGRKTIFKLSQSSTGRWVLETIFTSSGVNPESPLALDPEGNVYFTSYYGGTYELTKPGAAGGTWTLEQISNSTGSSSAGLKYLGGNLYGVTSDGGTGFGSVFELSPPVRGKGLWTTTQLTSFDGGTDGSGNGIFNIGSGISIVNAGLIFGVSYGQAPCPSPGDCGTVYELQKLVGQWTKTVLYRFGGTDGSEPDAITASSDGNHVFGTTYFGGTYSVGTAFELSAPTQRGAAWSMRSYNINAGAAGFPTGNVLIDEDGLGMYVTDNPDYLQDVHGMIPLGAPYDPAGNTGVAPCIQFTYPTAGKEIQFTNVCSRRVDFWSCAGASAVGSNICSPVIDIAAYNPNFLNSQQSATLKVPTLKGLGVVGNVMECKSGWYPYLYADKLGDQHLDCAQPVR